MKTRITLLMLLFSTLCLTAGAQIATWTGPAEGDYWSPTNWSTGSTPQATDSVSIPAGFIVTLSDDAGSINRLRVSGKLVIAGSGILKVNQTVSPNGNPIVNLVGGTIENNGSFTVKNDVASASNTVINFAESETDNQFINNGTFLMNNTIGAYASTTGRGIGVGQLKGTSTFKMGGTMDFIIKAGGCLIETNGGGNLTLDGALVLGNESDFRNLRFIKIQQGGKVTISATANITVYTGFVSVNGVINMQSAINTAPGSSFTNYGQLAIHGGPTTTGYGIYFNPQGPGALNTFNNFGAIKVDGNFPLGFMYIGGTATAETTINNSGMLSLYSTDHTIQMIKVPGQNTFTFNNTGDLYVSSADLSVFTIDLVSVLNNTGNIYYNSTAVKQVVDFKGKVYSTKNEIHVSLPANENAQMILTDVTGRTIKSISLNNELNTISVSNLKGMYIVRLAMQNGNYSQKVSF